MEKKEKKKENILGYIGQTKFKFNRITIENNYSLYIYILNRCLSGINGLNKPDAQFVNLMFIFATIGMMPHVACLVEFNYSKFCYKKLCYSNFSDIMTGCKVFQLLHCEAVSSKNDFFLLKVRMASD